MLQQAFAALDWVYNCILIFVTLAAAAAAAADGPPGQRLQYRYSLPRGRLLSGPRLSPRDPLGGWTSPPTPPSLQTVAAVVDSVPQPLPLLVSFWMLGLARVCVGSNEDRR